MGLPTYCDAEMMMEKANMQVVVSLELEILSSVSMTVSLVILTKTGRGGVLPVVKPEHEGVGVDLGYLEETPEICEYFQHPEEPTNCHSPPALLSTLLWLPRHSANNGLLQHFLPALLP